MTHAPTQIELFAAMEVAQNLKDSGAKVIRIWAGGHDVTASMPLTRARLEEMRRAEMEKKP